MDSNLYKKNNVIEELAKKGFQIDEKKLDELFKKLKIEAIFEDDSGLEFYDNNVVNLCYDELFKDELRKESTIKPPQIEEEQQEENKKIEPEEKNEEQNQQEHKKNIIPADNKEIDDFTLLSESYEAQQKFKEYVISELSKKNADFASKSNEFQLNISERTISLVARSLAKKIAKYISSIYSTDANSQEKLNLMQEQNKALEEKINALEDHNKKLKLLLAETNKNLNSYKPSIFGLYKKVKPKENKHRRT